MPPISFKALWVTTFVLLCVWENLCNVKWTKSSPSWFSSLHPLMTLRSHYIFQCLCCCTNKSKVKHCQNSGFSVKQVFNTLAGFAKLYHALNSSCFDIITLRSQQIAFNFHFNKLAPSDQPIPASRLTHGVLLRSKLIQQLNVCKISVFRHPGQIRMFTVNKLWPKGTLCVKMTLRYFLV